MRASKSAGTALLARVGQLATLRWNVAPRLQPVPHFVPQDHPCPTDLIRRYNPALQPLVGRRSLDSEDVCKFRNTQMFRIAIEELVDAIGSHEATAFGDNLTQDVRYGIVWRRAGIMGDEGGNNRGSRGRARDAVPNPWLASSGSEKPRDAEPPEDSAASPPVSPSGPAAPQPGLPGPPPDARLPRTALTPGARARVWWLGVHGGAGESTLEQLLDGSRAAGHAWPVPRREHTPPRVPALCSSLALTPTACGPLRPPHASGRVATSRCGCSDFCSSLMRPGACHDRYVTSAAWSPAAFPRRGAWPGTSRGDSVRRSPRTVKPGDAMAAISAIEDLTTPVPASPAQADPVGSERSPAASPPTRGIARA